MTNNEHVSSVIMATLADISHRKNKDSQPLSETGPTSHDFQLNMGLLAELRVLGAFEGEGRDTIRAKTLADIQRLVSEWALRYNERKGGTTLDKNRMCIIAPFGSYCLGVHSGDSDIDVLAVVPKHVPRQDFFAEIELILRDLPNVSDVHVISDAFVPVVKFNCEGVDIDLGMARLPFSELPEKLDIMDNDILKDITDPKDVTCLNGPRVTYELLRRVHNVENFRMFLRCIKMWARRKGVYSNIVGFPGGVAWAIMAVNVCQLYPNMIPSMLLEKFFFLYMNWNFANPIKIAPLDECRAPPGAVYMPQWSASLKPRPMQVITPTYPVANATFNSSRSTVQVVKQEISAAHALSQEVSAGRLPFSALFTPSDFFSKYSNYVSVEVLAFRPEAMKPFYAYIESQIRKLVERLESDQYAGLEIAHPCTEHFGPRDVEGAEIPTQHVYFYVGLKFDDQLVKQMKEKGQSVNLSSPVSEFRRLLTMYQDTEIAIQVTFDNAVQVVKRKAIPEWVKAAYMAPWGTSEQSPIKSPLADTVKRKREEDAKFLDGTLAKQGKR